MNPQRIIIFGSTGGTGQQLVQQALDRGHWVTAFMRDPARLPIRHGRLNLVQGNVLRPDTLSDALRGQEAVLCALGRRPFVNDPVCSVGTQHVMDEMNRQGIRPLIVESSVGVGDSFVRCGGFQKFLFRTLLRTYFNDKERQEKYVQASPLDWVIARPVALTNGPATNSLRASTDVQFRGFASPSISRADVAGFMIDQIDQLTFLHQCPTLY